MLSALLSYPTADLQAAAGELRASLEAEAIVPQDLQGPLDLLIDELATGDLLDLEERYVLLFDRTRSLSLQLFEHVHGESRDRGQAMVDLKAVYEKHGLAIGTGDLPDFVPMFLEFLSTLPREEALELLAQPAHIFAALAERLHKRQSSYEAVFRVLVALAAAPKVEAVAALLAEADADRDGPRRARRRLGGGTGHLWPGSRKQLQGRTGRAHPRGASTRSRRHDGPN